MSQRGFTVRALGEIALRCIDLDAMVAFYRDVIGLEIAQRSGPRPYRIPSHRQGLLRHTAVLALFPHDIEGAGRTWAGDEPPADLRKVGMPRSA